jgi:hypothetical protein
MYLSLKEIEPYNMTGNDISYVRKFLRHITGNESVRWDGSIRPKSIFLDDVIYKEIQGPNLATGYLLSIDIDKYFNLRETGISVEDIFEEYMIGRIRIEFRTEDNPPNFTISTEIKNG